PKIGFALGFGALLGDSVKSFFKRRMGIAPGKPWYIIDQLDYVIGAIIIASPIHFIGFSNIIYITSISIFLTIIANQIGYALGIRKVKW
ncbi:CDP-archaeol synthase, partial [Candidatus Woesearchaeota archaeon]